MLEPLTTVDWIGFALLVVIPSCALFYKTRDVNVLTDESGGKDEK